jgi:hypothetical protein
MNHLSPAYVAPEDAGLFRVSEPGWYAFDDDHNPVLGPFNSDEEYVEAIRAGVRNDRRLHYRSAEARASTLLTDLAYQRPPRGVLMPRAFSASAI